VADVRLKRAMEQSTVGGCGPLRGLLSFLIPLIFLRLDDLVTIASRPLQLAPLKNGNVAARVPDHSGFLQSSGSHAHAGPACSKHLAQKPLG